MTDLKLEYFWEKVDVQSNGCWNFKGPFTDSGYGLFCEHNKIIRAHRFAYEVNKGKIPDGLALDHLCRNRKCVNPDHLEPVTRGENILRGESLQGINLRKTHCKYGHPLSGSNLYVYMDVRQCRICRARRIIEFRSKCE